MDGNSLFSGESTSENTSTDDYHCEAGIAQDACKPLLNLLELSVDNKSFVIDCMAGLSGQETVKEFPCLLNGARFYVLLTDTQFNLFTKSTFMNLCNFAENRGALSMVIVLDRNHHQKHDYLRMFKVIDAERLSK